MTDPVVDISVEACSKALKDVGVPPADLLARYMNVLLEVNQITNLTGAKNPADLALKHIADSFLAWNAIGGVTNPIYDVGSGGGLPGIVLSILSPHVPVFLVERRTKKASALQSIVDRLGLGPRVRVLAEPFEAIQNRDEEAELWFRGFLPGLDLAEFLSENFKERQIRQIVLMKGPGWPNELEQIVSSKKLKKDWIERIASSDVLEYSLPKEAGQRMLVVV